MTNKISLTDSWLKTIAPLFRAVISLVLLAVTAGLIGWMMIPAEIPHVATADALAPTVEVVPIQWHETGIDFSVDGEVIPFRRIDLVAEIQGRVVYKSDQCRLGKFVEKDELLLTIDPVDYQLAVDQAETAVRQARVSIDENEVQKTNAEKELALAHERLELTLRDYERHQQLRQRNTVTQADMDNVQASVLAIQEVIQQRENQHRVLSTQAERLTVQHRREVLALETAQLNLARTEIRAPISGIITEDSFEVHSFIQKGANVARILDPSQLEIQSSLHMRQIQWIWRQSGDSTGYVFPPTPVTVIYEMDSERWVWDGELRTLDGGMMNPMTRMVPCRVRVDDPEAGRRQTADSRQQTAADASGAVAPLLPSLKTPTLFAGMFVTIIVHSKPEIPLYRIPERALLPGNRIWTVVEGKLRQHAIRIATTTPEGVLFYADSAAIRPNDLVVVSPLALPIEGSPVRTTTQYAMLNDTMRSDIANK